MENKKDAYYVFLDIDGTLWDAEFSLRNYGRDYYNIVENPILKESSINALNTLLKKLGEVYDVKLVITSQRRKDLQDCVDYLEDNGLEFDDFIYSLKYPTEISRGNDIVEFMQENGEEPFVYASMQNKIKKFFHSFSNSEYSNYVVLEDEKDLIKKSIPANRIIYCNHDKKSLTMEQVMKYLKKNKIGEEFSESPSEKQ